MRLSQSPTIVSSHYPIFMAVKFRYLLMTYVAAIDLRTAGILTLMVHRKSFPQFDVQGTTNRTR